MQLGPDKTELLARSRADLRMGVPVVLRDGNALAIVAAAETCDPARLAALQSTGLDLHLAISARRAATLKARAYDGDLARIVIPKESPLSWVQAVADPADDLRTPMKGPLTSAREGKADTHRAALMLVKSARLLPAALVMAIPAEALDASLTALNVADITAHLKEASPMNKVVSARLPLVVSEAGRLHIWRPEDGGEEHYAIEIGSPPRGAAVLSRLHSACFTGDLLGSLKCDCGPQLRAALAQMGAEGAGVLLYLNQEGRGIGLANKIRAYALQDQGFDTVEANHRLGFEDDERDFRIGADILRSMGFGAVRLLTNNPAKIEMMRSCGIDVIERVPLKVGETEHNRRYLATKAEKSGHLF
ncbi:MULTISPECIES: GTP cyclohydrolase II [unclassified Roseovarius]|uniref:GTP cyclohydrolase II n=1 Tax=unclassified Roseovarius TaxID=2614913 RepID=UPI00273EE5E9|nr:GTP cyclohydrolase II [Roseovarius sp. MMSF_3350]